MQDENKLETFRKGLEKANYAVPDSATFAETLSDPDKAKYFYDALIKANYDVPDDFETFSSVLGLKKKDASEYFFPAKKVLDEMFGSISKESYEASQRPPDPFDPEKFKTPNLTLKTPETKGFESPSLVDIIGGVLTKDQIKANEAEFKKKTEEHISEIDKKIAGLPQDNTEMLPAMNFSGGLILPTRPVSEEKARLLKEKDDLKLAITTPDKLTYILGKAYNQSLVGTADKIINGTARANEEWLSRYDSNTLTDFTATALGLMLDMPFFGGMGRIGGSIGKLAAKPFVDRAMVRTTEKLIKAGIPEIAAKQHVLKAATKTSQIISSMASYGVALGSYGFVKDALDQWSQPDMDFDDIKWSQSFKRLGKDAALGIGIGGLGVASSIIASKASAIPNATLRVGTKAGAAVGGLTAESALFAYGGALLDGRKIQDVTGKEFAETVALLGMLKVSNVAGEIAEGITEPKKTAVKIYQSLKYSPNKPGQGAFEVDIEPWEIDAIGGKDYKNVMDILSKDDNVLGEIMKSDKVPVHLKQRLLWGSRGVGIEDIDLKAEKIIPNGEYIEVYNKAGVLLDMRKAPSKDKADQVALDLGLQLEDNKMQEKSAEPENKVKIISTLQKDGADIPKIVSATDKPVADRTPEEHKIVGDYSRIVPKGEVKPPKPQPEPPKEGEIPKGEMPSINKPEVPGKEIKVKTPEEVKKSEIKPKEEIISEETAIKINRKFNQQKAKRKRLFKPESRSGKAVNIPADNFRDAVMQYFISYGKVSKEDFIAYTGWDEADIKKSGVGFLLSGTGQKLDVFHEVLPNAFQYKEGGESMDMINEVIDIMKSHPNRGAMLAEFERRHKIEQPFEPTEEEIAKQKNDEKLTDIIKNNGGLNVKAMETAAKAGLISKEELNNFKNELENENYEQQQSEREWVEEEARIESKGRGTEVSPSEKPGGSEKEVKPEIKPYEESNKPGITVGKEAGTNIPTGTETVEKPVIAKGEEKPIRTTDAVKQKQIDDINKEYDALITKEEVVIPKTEADMKEALLEADERNGLFGDTIPLSPDEIIKREEQGFTYNEETRAAIRKPFEEKIAEVNKNIASLNKERESRIGEVLKQQTLGFEEAPVKEYKYRMELRPLGIGTYPKEGYVNAELVPGDKYETLTYNRKLTPEEISHWSFTPLTEIAEIKGKEFIDRDGYYSRIKLDWYDNDLGADVSMYDTEGNLVEKPMGMSNKDILENIKSGYWKELPGRGLKAVVTKENAGEFQEAGARAYYDELKLTGKMEVTFPERIAQGIEKYLGVKVYYDDNSIYLNKPNQENKPESFADSRTAKQNKKYKNEPKTDNPEELAWDEPLKISTNEDPDFKNSDLNNAMSIRNMSRNLIKNFGKIEGADIRTGFITRFSRRAKAIFNPVSGVIRVRSIRDLRALTHELGHWMDFEIFDIRGIISAGKRDPQLGTGVDFNGKIYSNVAEVEQAMKFHTISIDEGNMLLDKVRTFEKKKLAEKYSEIIEQGTPVGVKIKGKTYKSANEINDALTKGRITATQAGKKLVEFNNINKNLPQKLDKLRKKYGDDVVAGVLQRKVLKQEFTQILRDINYPSDKREEGITEFIYNYVMDPKQLTRSTPNALAWFEKLLDNAPEVKNALHLLRRDFAKYDAQDIRTKLAAEMVPAPPEKMSWLDSIVKLGKDPIYSVVNMLRPLESMRNKWKEMMDNNVLAYKDPWISAKQLLGQGGRSEQWLLYHPYFNRGNEVLIRKDIKGLMPIIKPLIGTNDYVHYQTYLTILDSMESYSRGKSEQAYFPYDAAVAGKKAYEKQYGEQILRDFQADIQKYNEALLDFAEESGILSKETVEYWKQEHQFYVPLRRIAETYEIMGGRQKTITRDLLPESEKVIFSRKGSEKQIRDIFESMIENTNHILAASERNLLNRNIADMFNDINNYNRIHKKGGIVLEEIDARGMEAYQNPTTGEIGYAIAKICPKNFRSPKGRILAIKEKGVPRFYDVSPEYYDDIFRVTNKVGKEVSRAMKILSAPSHWLQAGAVVYDPTFPVRNIARDQTSTWFTSKYNYLPTDFLKGIASAWKKDDFYQKWLASGGDLSFLVSADQAISNNYYTQKIGKTARRKFDAYKRNPLLALQDFSKASEIGTRLGAFKNTYKRTDNVRLAAIESRDITADYGIHGAMTKQAFQLYPFLNARVQWARTMVESMKNPASFMLKGMALTIPAALNWWLNNEDEESRNLYQSLPTWRRVGLFNIRIPGTDHFLPLPKGFYGVIFASSVESMLDAATKDDPRVLKEMPSQIFKEISPMSNWPEIIPFIGRPMIEMWANKKGYTGKPIVSESMKLLKPSEQFYNSTPEIMKKMGKALNWSPVKIQHYFQSYTGGAGIGAVNILDEVLQLTGLVEKKPEDTFSMLSRMPVFKALLTEKPIGLSSGYVSDFYNNMDKVEKVNVTFNNFVKTENWNGLEKFMSNPENKRMFTFYQGNSTALNSFRQALTFVRDSTYSVMKDDLISNKEKQDDISNLQNIVQTSTLKFKDAYDNQTFFDYGKAMDDIITKMNESKKDQRAERVKQENVYNPYWIQLRGQDKNVFERLKEYGGLRDIEQRRKLTQGDKTINLELEDVRRFNETLVKSYGENIKNMIGTDIKLYDLYQKTPTPVPSDPEQTQLKQLFRAAWNQALNTTNSDFQPTYTNENEKD